MALLLAVLSFEVVSAQVPQILYLQLNEGTGASTLDSAMPGIPGANPILSDPSGWETVSPFFGSAAWDSSTGVVESISTSISINHSTSFAVEFAIKPTPPAVNPPDELAIMTFGGTATVYLALNQEGKYQLEFLGGGGVGAFQSTVSPVIANNQWTFCSISYDKVTNFMSTYINGDIVSVVPVFIPFSIVTGGNPWSIGKSFNQFGFFWRGSIDEVRVWDEVRSAGMIRMGSVGEPALLDVGAGDISSPPRRLNRCEYYTPTETVTVEVCNPGLTTVSAGSVIPMTMHADGILVASESITLPSNLNPGDSIFYTFLSSADLSGPGEHHIQITSSFLGDSQPLNNTINLDFHGGGPGVVTEFPWNEPFDDLPLSPSVHMTPPPGWFNVQGELAPNGTEQEWSFAKNLSQPFPVADHSSETASTRYAIAGPGFFTSSLESPCIELLSITQPTLAFYLNALQPGASTVPGMFIVEVHSQTSGLITPIVGPIMNSGPDEWQLIHADLTPFVGDTIVLRFIRSGGDTLNSFSIDDVSIVDRATQLKGQAPQPGIAVLDISLSTNDHKEEVSSAGKGPYQKVSLFPAPLDFVFEGTPLQPFILLSGLLNEVNATYPNIGQMDIGGPIDPVSGFPTSLIVWGNGYALATATDFLFYTDATGVAVLPGQLPFIPFVDHGRRIPFGTFQAVMGLPMAPYFVVSNAVQLINW